MAKKPIHTQLSALEKLERHVSVKKEILLQKAVVSTNPSDILKAAEMSSVNIEPKAETERRSYILDPLQFNQFMGYKNKPYALSYGMLHKVSYGVPIIRSIIGTRLDQIADFCEPQGDKYSTGFVVRKKKGYYQSTSTTQPNKAELKEAERITDFILNCGAVNSFESDDFDTFTRKVMNDSYMYDQMTFEVVRNRKGIPINFYAVDAKTIRISDSFDSDAYRDESSKFMERQKIKGYYPTFCQIENGVVRNDFYPWEMCFGVRNPVTDIYSNGYGVAEIEILINVITSMLWGDEYNRRFFSQGSAPKGFLKLKGGTMTNNNKVSEFKQAWQSMMVGALNSHKTPMLEGDIEWVDLQHTNRDMEFSNWQEYLIKLACAIYRIDPAEINFPLSGGAEQKAMFEGNNEARLKHSKDKGLYPNLKFYQRKLNKFVVNQLNPEFELAFVGLNGVDIGTELDQDVKKVGSFMTLDEVRVSRGLPALGEERGGNMILNSVYQQMQNAKLQEQQMKEQGEMAGKAGKQPDGANEEEQQNEDEEMDPFEKAFNEYVDKIAA